MILCACVGAVVLAGCSADDEVPMAENPCERLREHMIDLRLAGTPPADLASHRDVMRRALGDEFLASCAGSLSPAQIRCALDAQDSATAAACSTSATR